MVYPTEGCVNCRRPISAAAAMTSPTVDDLLDEWGNALPQPRPAEEFSTEHFLHGIRAGTTMFDADCRAKLDRLVKKVEVVRRVSRGYSRDLSSTVDSRPIAPEYARYMAALYLHRAVVESDPKFLNCALKLSDGILEDPDVGTLPQLKEIALEQVRRLVNVSE